MKNYLCCWALNVKYIKRNFSLLNLLTRKSFFIRSFISFFSRSGCGKEINIYLIRLLRTSTIHHIKLIFLFALCFFLFHSHQKQRAFKMIFTELLNKVCEAKEIYARWSVLQHLRHFQIKYYVCMRRQPNGKMMKYYMHHWKRETI